MRNYTVMCWSFDNNDKKLNFIQVPNVIAYNEDDAKSKALQILARQGIKADIAPDMGIVKAVIDNGAVI